MRGQAKVTLGEQRAVEDETTFPAIRVKYV